MNDPQNASTIADSNADSARTLKGVSLISEAFSSFFGNFRSIVRIIAVPFLVLSTVVLFVAPSIIMAADRVDQDLVAEGMLWALEGLSIALLGAVAIAIHRLVLLEEKPHGLIGIHFGRREIKYLAYVALIYGFIYGPIFALEQVAMIFGLEQSVETNSMPEITTTLLLAAYTVLVLVASVFMLMVSTRLTLMVPALAVDRPAAGPLERMRYAWAMSKGAHWRLLVDLIFTLFIFAILGGVLFLILGAVLGLGIGSTNGEIIASELANFSQRR